MKFAARGLPFGPATRSPKTPLIGIVAAASACSRDETRTSSLHAYLSCTFFNLHLSTGHSTTDHRGIVVPAKRRR